MKNPHWDGKVYKTVKSRAHPTREPLKAGRKQRKSGPRQAREGRTGGPYEPRPSIPLTE
jgi:hypothetical protein